MVVAARTSQRRVLAGLSVAVLVLSSVAVAIVVTGPGRRAASRVAAGATAAVLPSASTTSTAVPSPAVAVDTSGVRLPRVDEALGSAVDAPSSGEVVSPAPPSSAGAATATDERVTVQPEQCSFRSTTMPIGVELVAVATADGLRLRSADGRTSWSLAAADGVDLREEDVAWEPGGTRVAFTVTRASSSPASAVIVADAASLCWRAVTPVAVGRYDRPAWLPDGRLGYRALAGPDVDVPSVVIVDVRDPEAAAKRVPISMVAGPVWAPDRSGRFAFTDHEGLKVHDPTGTARLLVRAADALNPSWSPDATRLAFSTGADTAVWSVRADGAGGGVRLSPPDLFQATGASWSRDGARLAFVAALRVGRVGADVWTMPADGGLVRQLTSSGLATGAVAWSADGSLLAFADPTAVVVADAVTGERRALALEGRPIGFVRSTGRR